MISMKTKRMRALWNVATRYWMGLSYLSCEAQLFLQRKLAIPICKLDPLIYTPPHTHTNNIPKPWGTWDTMGKPLLWIDHLAYTGPALSHLFQKQAYPASSHITDPSHPAAWLSSRECLFFAKPHLPFEPLVTSTQSLNVSLTNIHFTEYFFQWESYI